MSLFIVLEITVLLFSGAGWYVNSNLGNRKNFSSSTFYACTIVLLLSLFMGLRGNYTADYTSYIRMFYGAAESSLGEILNRKSEHLFYLLGYVVGGLGANSVVYFTVVAAITVGAYMIFFRRYSPSVWLSVLMLLCVGSFYTSANAMRNILAASLFVLIWKYAESGEIGKFLLCDVLVSMFHFSAILLLPTYFVLRLNWRGKYKQLKMLGVLIGMVVVAALTKPLVNLAMKFVYQSYKYDGYGMDRGLQWSSFIKVVGLQLFIMLNLKKLDLHDPSDKVLYNASLLYTGFYLCAMNITMLQRFAFYFDVSQMVLVPRIIKRQSDSGVRAMMYITATFLLLLYSYLSVGEDRYIFFWQSL